MLSPEQAERICRRLAAGEKRKQIAAAESVSVGTVYNIAHGMWRQARDALRDATQREPTRRCAGCGILLYESMAECLQCKISELAEQDRQTKAAVRSLLAG